MNYKIAVYAVVLFAIFTLGFMGGVIFCHVSTPRKTAVGVSLEEHKAKLKKEFNFAYAGGREEAERDFRRHLEDQQIPEMWDRIKKLDKRTEGLPEQAAALQGDVAELYKRTNRILPDEQGRYWLLPPEVAKQIEGKEF